jgi:hypothetical protein
MLSMFILVSPQMAAMAFSAESNFSTAASACTTRKFSRSSAVQTSCQVKGVWVTIHDNPLAVLQTITSIPTLTEGSFS